MGTEIQFNMYFPRYHAVNDLNDKAGKSLPLSPDIILKSAQQCNGFSRKSRTDMLFGSEKEQLRQTVLKQESIFRHQLHELHRVYKIQKSLMNEIKSNELSRCLAPMSTSQSSFFSSSCVASEDDMNRWKNHNSPLSCLNHGRVPTSEKDIIESPFVNVKEDHYRSESKVKHQKQLFDLELPADVYMNGEEEHSQVSTIPRAANYLENSHYNADGSNSNACSRSSHTLKDLNQPLQVEDPLAPSSANILGKGFPFKAELHRTDLSASSRTTSEPLVGKNTKNAKRVCESVQGKWSFNTVETGQAVRSSSNNLFSQSSCFGISPAPPSSSQVVFNQILEPTASREPWTNRKIFGVEISERNHEGSSSITYWNDQLSSLGQSVTISQVGNASSGSNKSSTRSLQGRPHFEDGLLLSSSLSKTSPVRKGISFHSGVSDSFTSDIKQKEAIPHSSIFSFNGSTKEKNHEGLSWQSTMMIPFNCEGPKEGESSYQMSTDSLQKKFQQFVQDSTSTTRNPDSVRRKAEVNDNTQSGSNDIGRFNCSMVNSSVSLKSGATDEKHTEKVEEASGLRNLFDLNVCITEEEDASLINLRESSWVEVGREIDLEVPLIETDESNGDQSTYSKPQQLEDGSAAEILVSISSSKIVLQQPEASLSGSLHLFAEIISSLGHEVDTIDSGDFTPKGIDYFEFMTLSLTEETCEMEVLNNQQEEKEKNVSLQQPQKGPARRGRQRKDFQRDVLPGLSSLSRNEVTEDLQTMEGLIRAASGDWRSSSMVQRNTAAKGGKARLKRQSATNSPPPRAAKCRELGVDEGTLTLTGWGKRARRPRRTRCSAAFQPSSLEEVC